MVNDATHARATLKRVFGVGTFSRVETHCDAELPLIAETAKARFSQLIKDRRYAVRVRRRGDHSFRSGDVKAEVGSALKPYGTVDLDAPDVSIYVEILDDRAFLFTKRESGAGGLPVGTQGRALALFSGGFDSPVAAWHAMKRGIAVDFLFCNLAGSANERQVTQVAKVLSDLWAHGTEPRLYVLDFMPVVENLKTRVEHRFWQVVLKRQMYRVASLVAGHIQADALVTGESIGQVSSQTLSNLQAIEPAADRLMLRPLIGQDKREIMDRAREIGTAPLSERIPEFCSLTSGPVVVGGIRSRIDEEEAKLGHDGLDQAFSALRCLDLDDLKAEDLQSEYLFVDTIPDGAEIIDCQPAQLYSHWHLPGAVNRTLDEVLENLQLFDKQKCYILYCSFGTQSAHLAEVMQQLGYQAYALRGGVSQVRQRYESLETS